MDHDECTPSVLKREVRKVERFVSGAHSFRGDRLLEYGKLPLHTRGKVTTNLSSPQHRHLA